MLVWTNRALSRILSHFLGSLIALLTSPSSDFASLSEIIHSISLRLNFTSHTICQYSCDLLSAPMYAV